MTVSWWELHDELEDDWLAVDYCETCGRALPEREICAGCGDEESAGCAPNRGGLACRGPEGSTAVRNRHRLTEGSND